MLPFVTEVAAIKEALGTLKAHGFQYDDLHSELKGDGHKKHSAEEIIGACAALLRKKGHNACAEGLLKMQWEPA